MATFSISHSDQTALCSTLNEAGSLIGIGRHDGFTIYEILKEREEIDTQSKRWSKEPHGGLRISFDVALQHIHCCFDQRRLKATFGSQVTPDDSPTDVAKPPPPNDIEIKSLADVCDGITHLALYGEQHRLAMVARPRQVSDGLRRRWQGGGYDCMPSATSVLIVRCTDASHAQITHEVTVENDVLGIFLASRLLGVSTATGWSLYTDPMEAFAVKQAHQEKFDSAHPSTPQHPPPFVFCAKFGLLLTRSPRTPCGIALYGIKLIINTCGPVSDSRVVKYAEDVSAMHHCVEKVALHVGPQKPHETFVMPNGTEMDELVIRVAASSVKRTVIHVLYLDPQVTKNVLLSIQKLPAPSIASECVVSFKQLLKQHVNVTIPLKKRPPLMDQLQFVGCGSCIMWFDAKRRHVSFLHDVPTSAMQETYLESMLQQAIRGGKLWLDSVPLVGSERLPVNAPLFFYEIDYLLPKICRALRMTNTRAESPPKMICLNCINCRNGDLLTIRDYPQYREMYASTSAPCEPHPAHS